MTMTVDYTSPGLAAVLDRDPAGEEIIPADAGKPYARVVKLDTAERTPGRRKPGGWPDASASRPEGTEPVGTLDGAAKLPRRQPGGWPELANIPDSVWFDPLPDDELDAWEGKYSNIL